MGLFITYKKDRKYLETNPDMLLSKFCLAHNKQNMFRFLFKDVFKFKRIFYQNHLPINESFDI